MIRTVWALLCRTVSLLEYGDCFSSSEHRRMNEAIWFIFASSTVETVSMPYVYIYIMDFRLCVSYK
jgi:hypothetical protein